MLIDASSYRNLEILDLVPIEDLETVTQVAEEIGEGLVAKVHRVTREELNSLLGHLKTIAKQTDMRIYAEFEKNIESSTIKLLNPRSTKGKISIHYGELCLLSRAISHPDIILCDDESVFRINDFITGICGIELKIVRTIEHLYANFIAKKISATEFTRCFKKMGELGIIHFRYPPKDEKDKAITHSILDFMFQVSEKYDE